MADSSSVTSEIRSALSNAPQYYLQKPNKEILFLPLKRMLYCIPNPNDSSFWGRLWHKTGEQPVIYDRRAAAQTAAQLNTLLKTKGSFNSTVTVDTSHKGSSFVDVTYKVVASHRKTIDEVVFNSRQQDINILLQQWKDESLLKVGDFYDQELMIQEQQRIVNNLKNQGYYYANKEMVHFLVDTTYNSKSMGILLIVRIPQNAEGKEGNTVLNKYRIGDIYIYPNVSTALAPRENQFDTLIYPYKHLRGTSDLKFIHKDEITPSPKAISRQLFIFPGMTYRPQISSNTTNSLLGLHNFKYVDISFEESPHSTDSLKLLDARIRLLNSRRHRVSLSFELTNASDFGASSDDDNFFTSGNLGIGTSVSYENNNLFGGAERFSLKGGLIFDFPKKVFTSQASTFYEVFSNFESDITASLDLPSFVAPFGNNIVWQSFKPHTLFQLSYNYIFRNLTLPLEDYEGGTYYSDLQLERIWSGASFGYTWNQGQNIQHKLLPFNLSYSRIISGDEYYQRLAELTHDAQFLYQTYDFVLLNTHYEYTYTNQNISKRKNFKYLRFSVETAGNVLNGVAKLFGFNQQTDDVDRIEFSQYFKLEGEFKQYFYLGKNNTLVLRALGGFAFPYGQSYIIPYEKMFTGGGPTTLRGWSLRHLGPGQEDIINYEYAWGVAPIQLVFNIEERFPLFSIFEGAVFTDIGNVWDWADWGVDTHHSYYPPGESPYVFDPLYILGGMGVDAGVGLRAKISVITIRLDVALPIYDPRYPIGQRIFTDHWKWKNLALNFGINYPF